MSGFGKGIALRLFAAILTVLTALPSVALAASEFYPRRVVSLAPSITETVFALGFGDRLVGVTTYCDYPAAARKIAKIGGFMNPSVELIVAKQPDLVLGVSSATDPVRARELERLGLDVRLISLANVSEILSAIRTIARLLGSPESGKELTRKIIAQIDRVKQRVAAAPSRSTLLAVGLRPLVAVGGKNFIDELISFAGGENIAHDAAQPWLNLPDEYVVAKAPEVIIEAGMGSERGESVTHWTDLKSIPAVKNGRVYNYVSDKILRPGPRIGEALDEIARLIHPECFAESKRSNQGMTCERPQP